MNSIATFRGSVLALGVAMAALTGCDSPEQRAQMHMQRAIDLFEAKNYEQARLEFRNTLQLQPTNAEAYYYLGRIYDSQQAIPDAARAFMSAVAQDANHQDASIRLARYYMLGGGVDEAMRLA